MRSHHAIRMLAAVAVAGGITAPAAYARFDNVPVNVPPLGNHYAAALSHHAGGSPDWTLIGAGAAGGLTLLGAGVATSRRATRRTAPASRARPESRA
jgi:hypothetical protein